MTYRKSALENVKDGLSWVVMPNHVHCLIETFADYGLADVVQAGQSFTAKQANPLLRCHGEVLFQFALMPLWHLEFTRLCSNGISKVLEQIKL